MLTSYTQLSRRFLAYSGVGISTYIIDLCIIYLAERYLQLDSQAAIALGFLVGISLNYFFCYTWVYRETNRHPLTGYLLFAGVALLGVSIITATTSYLMESFSMNLYLARTIVAILVGIANFLFNTFLNFRVF